MFRTPLFVRARLALACVLAPALLTASCDSVDLATAIEIGEIESGYYDAGVTDMGLNKLVPSITLRLKNISEAPVTSVDMVLYFRSQATEVHPESELDEIIVTAIGSDGLAPAAMTEPLVVRSKQGYTLEQARAELFVHRDFRDVTVRMFLKRAGKLVPIGDHQIERRLLLATPTDPAAR
jgi:hypothetical protein